MALVPMSDRDPLKALNFCAVIVNDIVKLAKNLNCNSTVSQTLNDFH